MACFGAFGRTGAGVKTKCIGYLPLDFQHSALTCKSNEIIDSITSKRTYISTLFSSFLELTHQCSGASNSPGLLLLCLLLLFFPLFCLNVLLSWRSSSLEIFAPINTTRIVQLTPYLHISTMLADLHICYMYTYIYETLSKT